MQSRCCHLLPMCKRRPARGVGVRRTHTVTSIQQVITQEEYFPAWLGKALPEIIAHGKCLPQGHAVGLGCFAIVIVPRGPGHRCVSRSSQKLQELTHCLLA